MEDGPVADSRLQQEVVRTEASPVRSPFGWTVEELREERCDVSKTSVRWRREHHLMARTEFKIRNSEQNVHGWLSVLNLVDLSTARERLLGVKDYARLLH